MGGIATDQGKMLILMTNDIILKQLLLVPQNVFTNFAELRINYFVEGYTAESIVIPDVCRLLIKSAPMSSTNNEFVKENNVIIEVFVPSSKDRMDNFERRTNLIISRLMKLFHNQVINDRKFKLVTMNDLQSSVVGFKRAYVQFNYKRSYS